MAQKDRTIQVLEQALQIFSKYGYKKTTLEDIAGSLGITKGALYAYSENKKDLYEKAVALALKKWQDRVKEEVLKAENPRDKFLTMSLKAYQYLAEDSVFRNILAQDPDIFPLFPYQDPYNEINENSRALLRSILAQGAEQGIFRPINLDSAVWLLFSIYKMFIIDTYILEDKEATDKLFKDALDLILGGLQIGR